MCFLYFWLWLFANIGHNAEFIQDFYIKDIAYCKILASQNTKDNSYILSSDKTENIKSLSAI